MSVWTVVTLGRLCGGLFRTVVNCLFRGAIQVRNDCGARGSHVTIMEQRTYDSENLLIRCLWKNGNAKCDTGDTIATRIPALLAIRELKQEGIPRPRVHVKSGTRNPAVLASRLQWLVPSSALADIERGGVRGKNHYEQTQEHPFTHRKAGQGQIHVGAVAAERDGGRHDVFTR